MWHYTMNGILLSHGMLFRYTVNTFPVYMFLHPLSLNSKKAILILLIFLIKVIFLRNYQTNKKIWCLGQWLQNLQLNFSFEFNFECYLSETILCFILFVCVQWKMMMIENNRKSNNVHSELYSSISSNFLLQLITLLQNSLIITSWTIFAFTSFLEMCPMLKYTFFHIFGRLAS